MPSIVCRFVMFYGIVCKTKTQLKGVSANMDYFYKILPVFFLLLGSQTTQAEAFKVNQTKNDPNIKLGFEQRDIAYSKSFANKYKLDKSKVEKLSHGLQAIEFIISKVDREYQNYECSFTLYLSQGLGIRFPENADQGEFRPYSDLDQITKNLPPKLRKRTKEWAEYKGWGRGLSLKLDKNGDSILNTSLTLSAYKKAILDDLDYVRFDNVSCNFIDTSKHGYEFWMENNTAPVFRMAEYRKQNFIVELPIKMHERMCPYLEKAISINVDKFYEAEKDLFESTKKEKVVINHFPYGCD